MVVVISFQFEFQKKWKYQIILFDLSIVSLDIAKTGHAFENNLTLIISKYGYLNTDTTNNVGNHSELFANKGFPKM